MRSHVSERALPAEDRRDDVQGLRAVAVVLVVAFHVWPDAVPAGFLGVDVFFVISGFLITRALIVTPPRGWQGLAAFWGRRIRRLLPAAFVVLAATMVAARFLTPETQWLRTAREGVASAFYAQNWLLVEQSADYLAPSSAPTAVQHYWSLAVEEQFYLVWPVLILGIALLSRRSQPRSLARIVIAVVLVVSLAHGFAVAQTAPEAGYFMTTTRVWELAAGGLLATWIPPERMPRLRSLTAWLGLGVVVTAGLVLAGSAAWTGQVVAVAGACLFVWSASGSRWSPGLVLGHGLVQRVGDMSYSIYLWHWPVVVLAGGAASFTVLDAVSALALTGVLAWVTYTFVERPWRAPAGRPSLGRPFQLAAVGTAGIVLIAGAQVLGLHLSERAVASPGATVTDPCFGASAPTSGPEECPVDPAADVVPSPALAVGDRGSSFDHGCLERPPYDEVPTCTVGSGSRRVALVGNSHAAHWLPTLQAMAARQDLTITTFLISTCTTVDAPLAWKREALAAGCESWRDQVVERTSGDRFDLVITSQRSVMWVEGEEAQTTYEPWVAGMRSVLRRWAAAGTNLLVVRDTPFPGLDVPQCVAEHPTEQTACSGPRSAWEPRDPLVDAAVTVRGVDVVDLNDHLCTATTCSGVVGGVVAYFDNSHLTATFARSMTPYLEPIVAEQLGDVE